jgi:hypothetical protein
MLRTAPSLPLDRAFDAGLRPRPFPDQTASLLPGLLAATRTGLPPASDDELTNPKMHHGLRHDVTSGSAGRTKKAQCAGQPPRRRVPARVTMAVVGYGDMWLYCLEDATYEVIAVSREPLTGWPANP